MVVKHRANDKIGTMDRFLTVMRLWLGEVRDELAEAISILSSAGLSGTWWADRLKKNMECDEGPSTSLDSAFTGEESTTLLEIAFWSGWLKGEKDIMERITGVASDIRGGRNLDHRDATLSSFGLKLSDCADTAEEANITSLASEMVAEMEKKSYRPEIEMISISLSSAIDGCGSATDIFPVESKRELDDFVSNGSTTSLTMLSFNCGLLAGRLIQASQSRIRSEFIVDEDRKGEGV